jgi:sugar lactone lactonase YvrE
LIGVQSVVIDSLDRLWILDIGRVLTKEGLLVQSSYGGPKIVGVNLTTNEVFQTILFPRHVTYPDSYIDDLRFDLRPELTESGKGVAYITDASPEGHGGIIIVDLGTSESWRHLNHADSTKSDNKMVPFVWGEPVYGSQGPLPFSYFAASTNGTTLSPDGETLYFGPFISRHLYSVPTSNLRDRTPTSEIRAQAAISDLGQKGWSDGFESDTNGLVYLGNAEQNAVVAFNPKNGTVTTLVRDPRINTVDTRK